MAVQQSRVNERILQEYLQSIAEDEGIPEGPDRAKHLLISYAEFRFRVVGGSQCPLCRASVRHVLKVTILRPGGETVTYPCLCHRCLEAERDGALSIEIGLADLKWELPGHAK